MCSKMAQYMALDETETTRTINKVKRDDIGVVCAGSWPELWLASL